MAALIVLMAQMGSFVPTREALVGIADRIYCRVGASDNLARGESTFLAEMNETAYILNTATSQSLVIMDEVGRGTGTKDGLSIAWAVCEDLLDRVTCRTLFATHYHELSLLVHPRLANRSMEVINRNGEILFLRRIKEGPSAESYGIHVARMAGLAEPVLARAEIIMAYLRDRGETLVGNSARALKPRTGPDGGGGRAGADEGGEPGGPPLAGPPPARAPRADPELTKWLESLRSLDLNTMTPLDALNLISQWKRRFTPGPQGRKGGAARPGAGGGGDVPSLFDESG
jgi:DNA mismatch repair protein MutS